jgi:hypothetical protein
MQIKLTEGQKESFSLLHTNVNNALMYAEDLYSYKVIHFKDTMGPVVTKLRWLKSSIELKIPSDKRPAARGIDTLRYDEIARLMAHMNKDQLDALENFAKTILIRK